MELQCDNEPISESETNQLGRAATQVIAVDGAIVIRFNNILLDHFYDIPYIYYTHTRARKRIV